MKKYNVQNYIRYKEDLKASMPEGLFGTSTLAMSLL